MLGRVNRRRRVAKSTTIDVASWIDRIEERLQAAVDHGEVLDALAILHRWQVDEMIDASSRERARVLIRRFSPFPAFGPLA